MEGRQVLDGLGALGVLRVVVLDKGHDFVYRRAELGMSCVNFTHDGPSCIVGHALERLGVTADEAHVLDIDGEVSADTTCRVLNEADNFGWEFTPEAVSLFTTVQVVQDSGQSWGYALDRAAEQLAEMLTDRG